MKKYSFVPALMASVVLLVTFQNCSNGAYFGSEEAVEMSSISPDTIIINTEMNTPVEFNIDKSKIPGGISFNFSPDNSPKLNGTYEVINTTSVRARFTPQFGFRGIDRAKVLITDASGSQISFPIIATVGNHVGTLQPALAVRGMACLVCHSNVSSNVITDFGLNSSYYFSANPNPAIWNSGGIYGDHVYSLNTLNIATGKSVIVPAAQVPSIVRDTRGVSTIAEYVRKQFLDSPYPSTKASVVSEKSSIYIGAPTDIQIQTAFKLPTEARFKYYKDSSQSTELSGLLDRANFFHISGNLNCDGDLVLRGPLLIENINLNTIAGCRLYVMGSVFMYGPVKYANATSLRNLQITSTRSINMGLGIALKNGFACLPGDRYDGVSANNAGTNSFTYRYDSIVGHQPVRQNADSAAFNNSIKAEATLIQNNRGLFYDATCLPEGRNVAFERLLLNAPVVQSRYVGNFSGTIIAEYAVMSLGNFIFSFDEVFRKTAVLPFLDSSTYLRAN